MSRREARREMAELKKIILARYPDAVLREGPGFEGGPNDIFLYAYADEVQRDSIREMASPRILDILLKTDVLVHLIPLRPGTMQWLWGNGKKSKARRLSRDVSRVLAEPRAKYKVGKSAARRKVARKS